MLSKTQLTDQLSLQHKLNSAVDPNWVEANHHWTRAIMMEGAEALDHLGWKWWKRDDVPDPEQFRLELVDIWHFILSNELSSWGTIPAAANALDAALADPQYALATDHRELDLRELGARDLLHLLIGVAAFGGVHLTAFALLLERAEMPWDALHKTYLCKNVLNLFRQAHGYQDGTYIKQWGGVEDNVVLAQLMTDYPNDSAVTLMTRLETAYLTAQRETT